jgi:hypothetical protein
MSSVARFVGPTCKGEDLNEVGPSEDQPLDKQGDRRARSMPFRARKGRVLCRMKLKDHAEAGGI